MKILLALGDNALLKRGESWDVDMQRKSIAAACSLIAPIARNHNVVIAHGNGPQMGLLALQADTGKRTVPYPLDVREAEGEGMIGYLLEQEIINARPGCAVANLLTQTLVDGTDPAFLTPTVFFGPVYTQQQANIYASKKGWTIKQEGEHYRRVVPSPVPVEIIDLHAIRTLSDAGFLVICTGGGGIPVTRNRQGILQGVEAVVDKDLVSAKLAVQLEVDVLLLLTDVDAVYRNWGSDQRTAIRHGSIMDFESRSLATGSMRPKVQAACNFARASGKTACIGALDNIEQILSGEQGTAISPD